MHFVMPFSKKWESKPAYADSVAAILPVKTVFSNLVIMLLWTVRIQDAI